MSEITIEVKDDFVAWANQAFAETKIWQSRQHVDCQLFERELIKLGWVDKPFHLMHDYIDNNKLVDNKEIQSRYFSIPDINKLRNYEKAIQNNLLTHFCFFTTNLDPEIKNRNILKTGDIVNVKVLGVEKAQKTLNRKIISQFQGWYVNMNKFKM